MCQKLSWLINMDSLITEKKGVINRKKLITPVFYKQIVNNPEKGDVYSASAIRRKRMVF